VVSPVPTNNVTGAGAATVVLRGNQATITVDTNGLLNAVHFMHIHGGTGRCPTASNSQVVNGHRFLPARIGDRIYGGIVQSLTQNGDSTSPAVHVIQSFYQSTGNIRYVRTFQLDPGVASEIRDGLAVIVVHGIDYNRNGAYDNSLGVDEELNAPALCGALFPAQTAARGRSGTSDTIYTASLDLYGGSAGQRSAGVALLCHIAGVSASLPPTYSDRSGPTST
jgi:hypothetical protein